jgi:hypothetical protein
MLFISLAASPKTFLVQRDFRHIFVGGILSGLSILSQNLAVGASGAIQAIFAACAVVLSGSKHFCHLVCVAVTLALCWG